MKRARLDSIADAAADDAAAVTPATPKRHLFISLDLSGDYEMVLTRFAYTEGTNDKAFESVREFVLENLDGREEYRHPLYALFVYLCGRWDGERPPSSLPTDLWGLPLKELGTWEELNIGDSLPFVDKTQWASTIYFVANANYDESEDMIDEPAWEVYHTA